MPERDVKRDGDNHLIIHSIILNNAIASLIPGLNSYTTNRAFADDPRLKDSRITVSMRLPRRDRADRSLIHKSIGEQLEFAYPIYLEELSSNCLPINQYECPSHREGHTTLETLFLDVIIGRVLWSPRREHKYRYWVWFSRLSSERIEAGSSWSASTAADLVFGTRTELEVQLLVTFNALEGGSDYEPTMGWVEFREIAKCSGLDPVVESLLPGIPVRPLSGGCQRLVSSEQCRFTSVGTARNMPFKESWEKVPQLQST
ncbi:hypothetical protein B0H19DRAFT_1076531 [Mycena capillaripes]|nr:hypothetical protein B0H19DRAFT_1076531 [Mycena capillaripes]